MLILASQSAGRRQLLNNAGVSFEAEPADIDETAIREELLGLSQSPEQIALALAQEKARVVSARYPGQMVIGSDQLLVDPDGEFLTKAKSQKAAVSKLEKLSGKMHRLISAVAICENEREVWHDIDVAALKMRKLSDREIGSYVAEHWDKIKYSVGCYRIEAEGRQLFNEIDGDESTIVGMPMPALLDYLHARGYGPES